MEKAWKISDRDSAMEVIDKQITYGHQAKCRAYIQSNSRTKKAIEALEIMVKAFRLKIRSI